MDRQTELEKYDTGKLCGAKTDRGYNQHTASGEPFFIMDPRSEDIRVYDIEQQLSRLCRFVGALRGDIEMYSVAQHCCMVSDHLPDALKLEGLLHDAHEAYTGDVIKPIKMVLGKTWKAIEERVDRAVRLRFGLPEHLTPEVKHQDQLAVVTERRDVLPMSSAVDWGEMPAPWSDYIIPWTPSRAAYEFRMRFWTITGKTI